MKKEGGNRRERRANEKSKVDNTHRRTWDKEDYEERAAAREKVAVRRMRVLLLQGDSSWVLTSSSFVAISGRAGRGGKCNRCQAQEKAWCVDIGVRSSILCYPQTRRKAVVIPSTALHGHSLFLVCCTRSKSPSANSVCMLNSFPIACREGSPPSGNHCRTCPAQAARLLSRPDIKAWKVPGHYKYDAAQSAGGPQCSVSNKCSGSFLSLVYLLIMLCSQGVHTRQVAAL